MFINQNFDSLSDLLAVRDVKQISRFNEIQLPVWVGVNIAGYKVFDKNTWSKLRPLSWTAPELYLPGEDYAYRAIEYPAMVTEYFRYLNNVSVLYELIRADDSVENCTLEMDGDNYRGSVIGYNEEKQLCFSNHIHSKPLWALCLAYVNWWLEQE